MKQSLLILALVLPCYSCKQLDKRSSLEIDQTAKKTVTKLAKSADFKFIWKTLDKGNVKDSFTGTTFYLRLAVCADHKGKNDCQYVDLKNGYYSSGYQAETPHQDKDGKIDHVMEVTGEEIDRAARGVGSYYPSPLRKLSDANFKDYYLEFDLFEFDRLSKNDHIGSDCMFFSEIEVGKKFVIDGIKSSKAVIEIATAGFDDDQVPMAIPTDEKRQASCKD